MKSELIQKLTQYLNGKLDKTFFETEKDKDALLNALAPGWAWCKVARNQEITEYSRSFEEIMCAIGLDGRKDSSVRYDVDMVRFRLPVATKLFLETARGVLSDGKPRKFIAPMEKRFSLQIVEDGVKFSKIFLPGTLVLHCVYKHNNDSIILCFNILPSAIR